MSSKRRFSLVLVTVFVGLVFGCGKKNADSLSPIDIWRDNLVSGETGTGSGNFDSLTLYKVAADSLTITKKCSTSIESVTVSVVIPILLDAVNRKLTLSEQKQDSKEFRVGGSPIPCTIISPPAGEATYSIITNQMDLTLSTGAHRLFRRYEEQYPF